MKLLTLQRHVQVRHARQVASRRRQGGRHGGAEGRHLHRPVGEDHHQAFLSSAGELEGSRKVLPPV